jgi:hypothetical protein
MTLIRCRWCGQPAAGKCTAKADGDTVEILYCDATQCWNRTYNTVKRHPSRTFTVIEPGQPDLFDLLPDEGATQ